MEKIVRVDKPIVSFAGLRKVEPEDLDLLYSWENDAAAWRDGATHNPLSRADLSEYILSTTGDIYRDGQLRMIISARVTNNALSHKSTVESAELAEAKPVAVGCVDLYEVDAHNRKAGVAIYIAPEFRGAHLATEALRSIIDYADYSLHFRTLYAVIRQANEVSNRLFAHAGFRLIAPLLRWTVDGDANLYQWLPEPLPEPIRCRMA